MEFLPGLERWFHLMAGVMWIGLLYYFNFVQVAAMKAATADSTAAGISKHVAPRALLFFRWAAVVTWLTGAGLLGANFVAAFTFKPGYALIGMGAWLVLKSKLGGMRSGCHEEQHRDRQHGVGA